MVTRAAAIAAALLALTVGCAIVPPASPGPPGAPVVVAERGWHTDLCVPAPATADDALAPLAAGFAGARFLCFGFGERQYLLSGHHGWLEKLSALLPSRAVVLMTALAAPPDAAFGAGNVVSLKLSRTGAASLRDFLRRAVLSDAAGRPLRLRDGPYPGSVFFAAAGTYDAIDTCNTWTAAGLRAAGLPVGGPVVFAGQVMSAARRIAAADPAR